MVGAEDVFEPVVKHVHRDAPDAVCFLYKLLKLACGIQRMRHRNAHAYFVQSIKNHKSVGYVGHRLQHTVARPHAIRLKRGGTLVDHRKKLLKRDIGSHVVDGDFVGIFKRGITKQLVHRQVRYFQKLGDIAVELEPRFFYFVSFINSVFHFIRPFHKLSIDSGFFR